MPQDLDTGERLPARLVLGRLAAGDPGPARVRPGGMSHGAVRGPAPAAVGGPPGGAGAFNALRVLGAFNLAAAAVRHPAAAAGPGSFDEPEGPGRAGQGRATKLSSTLDALISPRGRRSSTAGPGISSAAGRSSSPHARGSDSEAPAQGDGGPDGSGRNNVLRPEAAGGDSDAVGRPLPARLSGGSGAGSAGGSDGAVGMPVGGSGRGASAGGSSSRWSITEAPMGLLKKSLSLSRASRGSTEPAAAADGPGPARASRSHSGYGPLDADSENAHPNTGNDSDTRAAAVVAGARLSGGASCDPASDAAGSGLAPGRSSLGRRTANFFKGLVHSVTRTAS